MTLIEAERLARSIGALLDGKASQGLAQVFAQEYADACRAANLRLAQCVAMIGQGSEAQALQAADESPALLDLVTRLTFRQFQDWHVYCRANGLPEPETLDVKAVRMLGEAYAKGIAADHQLYRQYREAVVLRKERQALGILRSIVRRNPGDATAPREIERLETKILQDEYRRLEEALGSDVHEQAAAITSEIEGLNFDLKPSGELWIRGLMMRCTYWLENGEAARAKDDQTGVSTFLSLIEGVLREHKLSLPPDQLSRQKDLSSWASSKAKAEEDERRFLRSVAALRQGVTSCESRIASADRLSRSELKTVVESLDRQWREVELFQRPVDEDLIRRTRKAQTLFRSQLTQRNRILRNSLVAAVALAVLAGFGASVFFWRQHIARDSAQELSALIADRRVFAVTNLLGRIRSDEARIGASTPQLRLSMESAQKFLTSEQERVQAAQAAIQAFESSAQKAFSNAPPENLQAQLDRAVKLVEESADDLRPPLNSTLSSLKLRWQEFLDLQRKDRLALFRSTLATASARATQGLAYSHGSERVKQALVELAPTLALLRNLETPTVPGLRLPAPELAPLEALNAKVRTFAKEVDRWDWIQNVWKTSGSLSNHLTSLQQLLDSEFADPTWKRHAAAVLSLQPSSTGLLRSLLLPGQPEAWARFELRPQLNHWPPSIMQGERARFDQLRDDEYIYNIWQFQITRVSGPQRSQRTTTTGYSKGPLAPNGFNRPSGLIYDPGQSPGGITFVQRDFDNFDYLVAGEIKSAESSFFEKVGISAMINSQSQSNFSSSLLGVLDAVNREPTGHLLFKAFLSLRLHTIIDLRPMEWDLHWSPAAMEHRLRLREFGADAIQSGDWMIPGRRAELVPKLEEFFAEAARVRYTVQAAFLSGLARSTLQAGFALCGHVDPAGEAVVGASSPGCLELWGWPATGSEPGLLFSRAADTQAWRLVNAPLPLSPLFKFQGNRATVAKEALSSATRTPAEAGAYRPPLYRDLP